MDDNITAISSSCGIQVGGEDNTIQTPDTYRNIFDKAFPEYLAMGMTYDEFYREDHTLAIAYRRAYEKMRKVKNEELWLMGAYVYEAISRVAPLLIPFNSHPKAEPYLDKPFPMSEEEASAQSNNAVADKGKAYMLAQMAKVNAKFGKTG